MNITRTWQRKLCASMVALASAGAAAQNMQLEEIVVTAQKRAENLQEVPVAISAFTAEGMEEKGITTTDDLSVVTPGLQAGRQTSSSTPYLRGVGTQSGAAGDEGSIAMYVDGVYSPSIRSNTMSFNNIERIEVLKGPQGTLFGRNATGGLIHVITRDPSQEAEGKLELSYGNYDTVGTRFYTAGGITETVAADIAILREDQQEGWGTNQVTGSDVNTGETTAYRSKVVITPTDATEIKLGLNYAESEGDIGMARQVAPGALGGDGLVIYGGCVFMGGDDSTCIPAAQGGASRYTGDWYDTATERDVYSNATDKGYTLHVAHEFGSVDFLSVTAYQKNSIEQFMDVDASQLLVQSAILDYEVETFTQEFQLTSNSDGPLEWILGLFYMDSTSNYNPFAIDVAGAPSPYLSSTNSQDTQSYSGYLQGGYSLTDATKLTLGVRLTRDEREMDADLSVFVPAFGVYVPITDTRDESWVEPTWRLSLDHQLSDETLLFASYSRGFKSGVYNLAGTPADPVDPEILDAWEVGIKTDLLDSRLRLNSSVFYYDYQDVQLQRVNQGAAFLVNAAAAEIYGVEVEALYLVTEALTLNAGLAVNHSEYTDYPDGTINTPTGMGGNVQTLGDLSGNQLIRTPDWTLNLGAVYSWATAMGNLKASVHYYYNDGFFWEPENRLAQDDYETINTELAWLSPDEVWRARLYAKNLLGEEYSYYGNSSQVSDAVSAAPPRTYGVAVEYSF